MLQVYDLSWIHSQDYRRVIATDLREANACRKVGAFKAACILIGSAIEGVLICALQQANIAISATITLNQLLKLAQEHKLLRVRDVYLGHSLRESRNFVHPTKCVEENYEHNQETTRLLFQIYAQITTELQQNLTHLQGDQDAR